jgi:hypothetical protein
MGGDERQEEMIYPFTHTSTFRDPRLSQLKSRIVAIAHSASPLCFGTPIQTTPTWGFIEHDRKGADITQTFYVRDLPQMGRASTGKTAFMRLTLLRLANLQRDSAES